MLLKLGSRGSDVETLQLTLRLRGYDIGQSGADGIFGEGTKRAVIEFQKDHNLDPDGIVGAATNEALHHDYSGNTDYGELLQFGSNGPIVAEMQRLLEKASYSVGSSGADGIFGEGTRNAVVRFQKAHGLGADGIIGPATKSALKGISSNSGLLRMGSRGTQVKELQRLLVNVGYRVGSYGVDGVFGQGTYDAVVRFQKSHGLGADGIVGPATWSALRGGSSSSGLLRMGSRGDEVKETQSLLINAGYGVGSYGADGVFGQGTYDAVVRFQKAHGLGADGIIGPATWSALRGGSVSSGLLRMGSRGDAVKEAQSLLINAGYGVGAYGADGAFGQGTYDAVVRFQKAHGLGADGIIGPATWSALRGGSSSSGLLRVGSRGDAVRNLQSLLINAGYGVGAYGADGVFGQGTYDAVIRFQKVHGLGADGIVGPATWGELYGSGGGNWNSNFSGKAGVEKFIRVAEAQEFHERIISSDGEGDNNNPYGRWFGNNYVPWCAIFVSWCAHEAGILDRIVPRYDYCLNGVNWYREHGRYRNRRSGYTPKPGDVIFFYDASEEAPFCHTGIVTGYDSSSREVITTEGNKAQAVRHNLRYPLDYWKIHGYGDNGGIKEKEKGPRDITYELKGMMLRFEYMYKTSWSKYNGLAQLAEFYLLVRNKGVLDLKNRGWNDKEYIFDGEVIRSDAPGNILYGYLGKAFGFSDDLLQRAAGFAQMRAGTSEKEFGKFYGSFPYGDDPEDQKNIIKGMNYYRKLH